MNIIDIVKADKWDNLAIPSAAGDTSDWHKILDVASEKIFLFAGVLAFIFLIYSGFIYLTAGGNPDAAKKGQQGLLNAILGLVIIFLSYGIVRFIVTFLNS